MSPLHLTAWLLRGALPIGFALIFVLLLLLNAWAYFDPDGKDDE